MREALIYTTALKLMEGALHGGICHENLGTVMCDLARQLLDASGFGAALEKSKGNLASAVAGQELANILKVTKPLVGKA